jgi:hypothetical protein
MQVQKQVLDAEYLLIIISVCEKIEFVEAFASDCGQD